MTIRPFHPGFTPKSFDESLHRAMLAGITARPLGSGQWVVDSGTVRGLSYLTTERDCPCKGSVRWGRCQHRALCLFERWLSEQAATDQPLTAA